MMQYTNQANHSLPPKPVFDQNPQQQVAGISPAHFPRTHDPNYACQYAFCIHLAIAPGPAKQDILYSTPNAEANWMHPPGCPPEKQQARMLPFYRNVVHALEQVCNEVREKGDGCSCSVTEAEVDNTWIEWAKNPGFETQRPKRDISIGVWMGGPNANALLDLRSAILERAPVQLVRFLGGGV